MEFSSTIPTNQISSVLGPMLDRTNGKRPKSYCNSTVSIMRDKIYIIKYMVPAAKNSQNFRPLKDILRPEFGKFKS